MMQTAAIRVTVCQPTTVVGDEAEAAAAFESAWSHLPPFREDNSFIALPDVDGGVFVKGQRIRPRVHWESLTQAGRLARETEYLVRMRDAGLPVPEVLAHGVERRFGFVTRSFLVLRLIPGAEDLRTLVRRTRPEERSDVWAPVGRLAAALHGANLFHRDLTARNVLIVRDGDAVDTHLIDCPRAEVGRIASRNAFLRRSDLFRLGRSVLKAGGIEDEVRRLLRAAGARDAEELADVISAAARKGGDRTLRTKLWIAFGR